ncbi:hypothetical protein PCO31110_01608 [Pandoraea communis]|uniref:Uncharacterized protein n=1 Tax=Pandoraea communis TaxID=2508297 RepID=A0A5E4TU77_9BURK|nr:hypothetical protein [Pandoraea communis]VVD90782.1 hypothetical protein PCO31110_01608 [Pandoraea communis]
MAKADSIDQNADATDEKLAVSVKIDASEAQAAIQAAIGDSVIITADSHAGAVERFAGLHAFIAKVEGIEAAAVDRLREDLNAIGDLLGLHSKASAKAESTGDYKASDLS